MWSVAHVEIATNCDLKVARLRVSCKMATLALRCRVFVMRANTPWSACGGLLLLILNGCALVGYDALPIQAEGGDTSETSVSGGGTKQTGGSPQGGSGGVVSKTGGATALQSGGAEATTGGAGDTTTGGVATGGVTT